MSVKDNLLLDCANCDDRICRDGADCTGTAEEIGRLYDEPSVRRMQAVATSIEANFYFKVPRLRELIEFGKEMNYKKVGVAFCIGLAEEVKVFCDILSNHFEVTSVVCKVCGIDKRNYDLVQIDNSRFEAICNPAGQAELLNRQATDLNVIFGLCMGHDIIFSQFSRAPVTTFVVKDRVLAHNPIGALNSQYYRKELLRL